MTQAMPRKSGLRLASYNVRKALGLDRRRDPARTLDVVAGLEADVIALQEADLRLGRRPSAFDAEEIARRTGLVPLPLGGTDVSLGWHGNAILARPGIKVGETRRIDLPGTEPRGAVLTHLETTQGGLILVGTHLGLLRRDRARQTRALQEALKQMPDAPAVILGDFNEWRAVGGLAPLDRDFHLLAPGRSYHAARPIAHLDRFALSKGVTASNAGVRQDLLSRKASDHLPIWADIALPPGGLHQD
ncbi:endonuclease/exonuclease/phosphatase family protein [Mesobacterium pallidum]|uniref:endonuclease/exonuclease/phosphatase family protein n=1 Tax=Mesobacterium pallidum TaxID=2872037 RepID=UPI001EE1B0DD|nr:endonuclease/exonuclease/phosphatase family protein [Mesobacterium pallidum]